jgi:DMSO/TMAO reductase YedYZ molybdopterin-dependent catalytic subunit
MTIMSPVSRGFHHLRRAPAGEEDRVPPGQYVTEGFPVLSAGPTPHTPLADWTFSLTQGGQTKKSWTWAEFRALPAETVTADIHCVTRWTKLGTRHHRAGSAALARPSGRAAPGRAADRG